MTLFSVRPDTELMTTDDFWAVQAGRPQRPLPAPAIPQYIERNGRGVPSGAHWDDIRSKSQNIGAAICKAMRSIHRGVPSSVKGAAA
jgi:hypothetical protein